MQQIWTIQKAHRRKKKKSSTASARICYQSKDIRKWRNLSSLLRKMAAIGDIVSSGMNPIYLFNLQSMELLC